MLSFFLLDELYDRYVIPLIPINYLKRWVSQNLSPTISFYVIRV